MKKLLIIMALCFNFSAQAATVTLTPSTTEINVGDIFSISVSAQDFTTPTGGATLGLSIESNLELANKTDLDDNFKLPSGSPFNLATFANNNLTLLTPLTSTTGASGDFDVVEIILKAIGEGPTSVTLTEESSNGWFDNATAQRIENITYNPATVNISAIPVPGAVWLFSSAIMGIIGLGRRKI